MSIRGTWCKNISLVYGTKIDHMFLRNTVATITVLQHIFVTSRAENWRLCSHHRRQSCQMTSEGACVCWKQQPHYYTAHRQDYWENRAVTWETETVVFHIEPDNQISDSRLVLVKHQPILTQMMLMTLADKMSQMDILWGNISSYT